MFGGDFETVGTLEGEALFGGFEAFEFAGRRKDAGLERGDCGVVGFDRGVEGATDLTEVAGEDGEAFVEFASGVGNTTGIFRERFLPPTVGDGTKERDEGGGSGEDDVLINALLEEGRILGECCREEGFGREEENDELGSGLELGLVVFRCELADVRGDLVGVTGEMAVAVFVGVGFERVEISVHGRFGIDDDLLSAGELDDEIGAEAFAFVGGGGGLRGEVTVLLHSGHLDDALKLHFAPLTAAGGLPQGLDELTGFLVETFLGIDERVDLFLNCGIGAFAGFFDFANAGLHFFEGLGDGLDEMGDGLLALFEFAPGLFLLGLEGGFGEVEELLLGGLEGVVGKGFEGIGEPLLELVGFVLLLLKGFDLGLELALMLQELGFRGSERFELGFEGGFLGFVVGDCFIGAFCTLIGSGFDRAELGFEIERGDD